MQTLPIAVPSRFVGSYHCPFQPVPQAPFSTLTVTASTTASTPKMKKKITENEIKLKLNPGYEGKGEEGVKKTGVTVYGGLG